MSTLQVRSTSVDSIEPVFAFKTGTVSVKLSLAVMRFTGISSASLARKLTNSAIPPAKANLISLLLASFAESVRPGTRKAVCLRRASKSGSESSAFESNICLSGQNLTLVPVFFLSTLPTTFSSLFLTKGLNFASGPLPSKTPGSPFLKDIACVLPPRSTSTSRRALNAFTTDAPTP